MTPSSGGKYLGVILDDTQSFRDHIEGTCTKATYAMQMMSTLSQKQFQIPMVCVELYMNVALSPSSCTATVLRRAKLKDRINRIQRGVLVRLTVPSNIYGGTLHRHWSHATILETDQKTTKRKTNEIVINKFQQEWTTSTKGRRLYGNLLPVVQPSRGLIHFLTGLGISARIQSPRQL